MCIYVCLCVHISLHLYIWVYVYLYVSRGFYMHLYGSMSTVYVFIIYMCLDVSIRVVCVYMCLYVYIRIYSIDVYIYIVYTYIYTHIHTYIYMHTCLHTLDMGQWSRCKSVSLSPLPCELGLTGFGETHLAWQCLALQRLPKKNIWHSSLESHSSL